MPSTVYDSLFGAVEEQTHELLERGRVVAGQLRQPLDTTHLVTVTLGDLANGQLAGYFRPEVAQALQSLLQSSLGSVPVDGSTSFAGVDSGTPALRTCAQTARTEAKGRPLSPRMLLWAIFVSDQRLSNLLEALHALHDVDVQGLLHQLHSDYERLHEIVHSFGPWAAEQTMTAALSQLVQEQLIMVAPTEGCVFAPIHEVTSADVLEILSRAQRFQHHAVVVVVGMHGTIVERIPQILADRLISGDSMLPNVRSVVQVGLNSIFSLAEADGIEVACSVLHGAMAQARDTQSILIIDHLDALDTAAEDGAKGDRANIASRLAGVLGSSRGVLVVARYWTGQTNNSLPSDSILSDRVASEWQSVFLKPYSAGQTRATIADHFFTYWTTVNHCHVDASAFEDVLAFSEWIYDSNNRIALPYAAIFLGTNACVTVKKGRDLVKQRAGLGLERIRQLRTTAADVSGLAEQLATIFDSVEQILRELHDHPDVDQTTDGLSHVTRGHVVAELFGTNVYRVVLPDVAPTQALEYHPPTQGGESHPIQVPPTGPGYKVPKGERH